MKVYLPAFDLVTTAPSVEAAALLQQGMLELLQYRGNGIKCFDDIEKGLDGVGGNNDVSKKEGTTPSATIKSLVGVCTKNQVFASVLCEMPWKAALEASSADCDWEPWERNYAEAAAEFCQFNFSKCNELCVRNFTITPSDIFSLRLLFISAFFIADVDLLATVTVDFAAHYRKLCDQQKEQQRKNNEEEREHTTNSRPPHCVWVTLPTVLAWAAFGVEEARQSLDRAYDMSMQAIQLTKEANKILSCPDLSIFAESIKNNNNNKEENEDATTTAASTSMARSIVRAGQADNNNETQPSSCRYTNVFAVHTVCHVWETKCDPASGIKWLGEQCDESLWQPAVHLAKHVWWHFALYHFSAGNVSAALDIYREHLSDVNANSDPFTISDATALIVRVVMAHQVAAAVTATTAKSAPTSRDPFLLSDGAQREQVRDASVLLNKLWKGYDGRPGKNTRLIPFFHVHKQLVHLLSVASSSSSSSSELDDDSFLFELPSPKIVAPAAVAATSLANNNNNNTHAHDAFVAHLDLLVAASCSGGGDSGGGSSISCFIEDALAGFYRVAAIEAGGGDSNFTCNARPSVHQVHSLHARKMGGSIAQRSLLYLLFVWLVAVAKFSTVEPTARTKSIMQDLTSAARRDAFVSGETSLLVSRIALWLA